MTSGTLLIRHDGEPAVIEGTLGENPDISFDRSGTARATLTVLVGETTTTVRCRGELAENLVLSLTKGHRVLATGTVQDDGIEATNVGASLKLAQVDVHRVGAGPEPEPES